MENNLNDRIKLLETKLDDKRKFFLKEINSLVIQSNDFDIIPDVQVKMLSIRHKLIDYLTTDLSNGNIQAKTLLDKGRKNTLIEIKTKYNVKISTEKEKTIVIDADTRHLKAMIELIDAQIYFVKESVKLLDNLGYAIKNNIEVYKFKNGG